MKRWGNKKTITIYAHRIEYSWEDGEERAADECDIEHIEGCLQKDCVEGELIRCNSDGYTHRGWWKIDGPKKCEMKKLSDIGAVEALMIITNHIDKVSDQLDSKKLGSARDCVDELAFVLGIEGDYMEALHDTEPDFEQTIINSQQRYEELKKKILVAVRLGGCNIDVDGRAVFLFDEKAPGNNQEVLELLKADEEVMKVAKFHTKIGGR